MTTSEYRRPYDAAALANNFRVFGSADCASEPLYARLSMAIAEDDEVLALLMQAPYPQRRPVLLFAATHDLLLAGVDHPLARFYRSVVVDADLRSDSEHAAAAFHDFCRIHRDALQSLLAERTVQTNEIGRSAGLRLSLARLASRAPLALIDVGCSAGLNLLVDRYGYRYEQADGCVRVIRISDVIVPTTLRGLVDIDALDHPPPNIAQRFGIDRSPLDVRDERDARWLRACVWPSDEGRQTRLVAAMKLARTATLDLRRGDAVERLDDVVRDLAPGLRPVVFHSWVASYFDQATKRTFVDAVRALVVERDGAWISAEGPDVLPGLASPPLPDDADATLREATIWHLTTREGDAAVTRVLARSHPHCRWIEWLEQPAASDR